MDLKLWLLIALGIFFFINGINHWYNTHMLEEYARRHGKVRSAFLVRLSGTLLILGGIGLPIPAFRIPAAAGLCVFLLLAAFLIHRFWEEKDRDKYLLELMNFSKNLAIFIEMLYIIDTTASGH